MRMKLYETAAVSSEEGITGEISNFQSLAR
jgi:hypothetical protein